eukprot:gene1614-2791_t
MLAQDDAVVRIRQKACHFATVAADAGTGEPTAERESQCAEECEADADELEQKLVLAG